MKDLGGGLTSFIYAFRPHNPPPIASMGWIWVFAKREPMRLELITVTPCKGRSQGRAPR